MHTYLHIHIYLLILNISGRIDVKTKNTLPTKKDMHSWEAGIKGKHFI